MELGVIGNREARHLMRIELTLDVIYCINIPSGIWHAAIDRAALIIRTLRGIKMRSGKAQSRYVYIHNIAKLVAGKIGIESKDFTPDPFLPHRLGQKYLGDAITAIARFSDEEKGKIVACARPHDEEWRTTSIYEVCPSMICLQRPGYEIMAVLAAATVLAAIADNIYKEHGITPSTGSRQPAGPYVKKVVKMLRMGLTA